MQTFNENQIVELAKQSLRDKGLITNNDVSRDNLNIEPIASDGSTRRFWRCSKDKVSICVIIAPLRCSETERKESEAAYYIGTHLLSKGCAVPQLFDYHSGSGMLLFEDLGDERLHNKVVSSKRGGRDEKHLAKMYRDVIARLIDLQIQGATGFDSSWCWDTSRYDREVMLLKESGYFVDAYWQGLLKKDVPAGIKDEFQYIADIAAAAPANYFLHRDFQSRNIMVKGKDYLFIDFQGGRQGPLGYDLASLLIDPYCDLSYELQDELVDFYSQEVSKRINITMADFMTQYAALALQRNLQILGAFAFLSHVRKKPFFVSYIKPALQAAQRRLQGPQFTDLTLLKRMIETGLKAA